MALRKGRIFPSQYRLPAGTKQEYTSETSGRLCRAACRGTCQALPHAGFRGSGSATPLQVGSCRFQVPGSMGAP
eukprot:scaffold78740_cov62-Phaeocystis_antarctica.AAC.2